MLQLNIIVLIIPNCKYGELVNKYQLVLNKNTFIFRLRLSMSKGEMCNAAEEIHLSLTES